MHFAAINDRKGIVEILLRSGADPSIPNSSGTLPVELSKSPAVQELFLRDRSAIFSPIVQTRMLLSDYIEQMNINPTSSEISRSAKSEMSRTEATVSSSNSMIFNMQDTLGAVLEQATPPSPTPEISTDIASCSPAPAASSPVCLTRDFSTLDRYIKVYMQLWKFSVRLCLSRVCFCLSMLASLFVICLSMFDD